MSVKHYNLTLKLISNLHIGSGLQAQKFEYSKENNFIKLVNENKFAEFLVENNLQNDFEKLLLRGKENPKQKEVAQNSQPAQSQKNVCPKCGKEFGLGKLISHIENCKVKPQVKQNFKKDSTPNAQNKEHQNRDDTLDAFIKNRGLSIPQNCFSEKIKIEEFSRYDAISLFMRNGEGLAYLPGSSIKGFIKMCLEANNIYDYEMPKKSALSVSDSEIIDCKNLIIKQVYYFNPTRKKGKPIEGLNFYGEFIKPQMQIKVKLSLDTNKFSIEQIKSSIQNFNKIYSQQYLNKFAGSANRYNVALENKINVLHLGRFTNFNEKTILLNNEGMNAVVSQLRSQYKKHNISNFGPACLKVTKNEDRYTENGICSFEFEEL